MVADAKSKAVAKRAPPIKYLLDNENPFRKKYGSGKDEFMEKAWVTAIQGEPAFAGVVCIKYLVMHIVVKTRDFFKGTNHEDDWLFYHDALSLLTAKDCIAWMKKTLVPGIRTRRTIYSCWVLPELNLNKEFARFHGRPVGN